MCGGNRRADDRGHVQPDSCGQQGGDHQPDKGIPVGDKVGVDDAAFDRANHIPTCDQRTACFKKGRYENGPRQGDGVRPNGRSDIVGHVIGADIHRHVPADHRGGDHKDAISAPIGSHDGKKHDADDKDQRSAEAEQFIAMSLDCVFEVFSSQHGTVPLNACVIATPFITTDGQADMTHVNEMHSIFGMFPNCNRTKEAHPMRRKTMLKPRPEHERTEPAPAVSAALPA